MRAATRRARDGHGPDGHTGALTCKPDGQTATLAALYGVQANLNVNVKVTPGCTGTSCIVNTDATAKLLLLAEVTQSGTTATVTARPCKIVIPKVALKGGNMPVILTAPDALVSSVKPVASAATLDGTMTCAHFNAQPITIALGANLASPSDPLPMFGAGMTTKLCGARRPPPASPTRRRRRPTPAASAIRTATASSRLARRDERARLRRHRSRSTSTSAPR